MADLESHEIRVQAWDDHRPRNASDRWRAKFVTPTLMNQVNGMHWAVLGRLMKLWQDAAKDAAFPIIWERFERARFTFLPVYAKGKLPDPGATAPSEKAIVDGIVSLGIIPDDNVFHNAGVLSLPAIHSDWNGFIVKISEKPKLDDHPSIDVCTCREDMEAMQRYNEHKRQLNKAKKSQPKRRRAL